MCVRVCVCATTHPKVEIAGLRPSSVESWFPASCWTHLLEDLEELDHQDAPGVDLVGRLVLGLPGSCAGREVHVELRYSQLPSTQASTDELMFPAV